MGTHYSVCTDGWRSEVKVTIFLYLHLIFNFLRMPLFMFYVDACFAEHMYTTCVSVKYRGQGRVVGVARPGVTGDGEPPCGY